MGNDIIVFGGDGFCGWPTSLYLSKMGYNVTIVDNFARRKTDLELGCTSLTPIGSMASRINTWKEVSGKEINFEYLDVADSYHRLLTLIQKLKPKAVVHFAEQRSAPHSMRSPYHKRYTISNNTNATHNILCAIAESGLDTHLVHLGSTGVYGYSDVGMKIPEGYLDIKVDVNGESKDLEIPYPSNPGSIYHLTKTQDALAFAYYNKNDLLRITDLHQGIVWGTQTEETKLDVRLLNRFDYEGDYGTVLNRFLMQSAIGHPITVHGTGGQTRAFIHIRDTIKCVYLAIENPPQVGNKVKIFNQTSECLNVNDLALKVSAMTGAEVRYYKNPRNEDEKNDLDFVNEGFKSLGWEPILLDEGLLEEVRGIVNTYKSRCDISKIICTSLWNSKLKVDKEGSKTPVKEDK